jgi:hypothetical protein
MMNRQDAKTPEENAEAQRRRGAEAMNREIRREGVLVSAKKLLVSFSPCSNLLASWRLGG